MDPKANGQLQQQWGWLVAVYLFLGGVGGGAYTIAAVNGFIGKSMEYSTAVGLAIAFPALLIGTIALLADLGQPGKAVLAGKKTGTSWIARGFWIISIFMVLAFIHFVLLSQTDLPQKPDGNTIFGAISVFGVIFAIGTMAYTGILLGASKGIPFWRNGAVPVVFVVSALVTGHFTIMLGMALMGDPKAVNEPLRIMALEAAALVVLEVLAIAFFLQAAYKLPDSRESATRILKNRLFVVGYFLLGLATPLALMLLIYLAIAEADAGATQAAAALGALLGLVGGLVLRQSVLMVGTLPTLNIAGFQFRRIARPKPQKPQAGLLPPS